MIKRDLVWAVQSQAPLLSRENFKIATESEVDLTTIPKLSHPYSRRLGKYFEDLIEQWLLSRDDITNLHRSIQIFDHERTVGEFDFLFLRNEKPIHWEVAVKFYLMMPDGMYWGPSFTDRLDIKIEKLIHHQLPLINEEVARHQIPKPFRENVTSEVFFKGQLFYPWGEEKVAVEGINPNHEWGYWIAYDTPQFYDFFQNKKGSAFQIIPKLRWLSPIETDGVELLLPYSSLVQSLESHFYTSDISLLISRLEKKGSTWVEAERFFVIHKHNIT